MPIRRYRSVEDVPAPARAGAAAEGLARACELSQVTAALGPSVVAPRGVRRFGSVEEADADRRGREILAMRQRQR